MPIVAAQRPLTRKHLWWLIACGVLLWAAGTGVDVCAAWVERWFSGNRMLYWAPWQFGFFAVNLVIAPLILVALSWREQRYSQAVFEALSLAAGLIIPVVIQAGNDVLDSVFPLILLGYISFCVAVRLIGLGIVRAQFIRLVEDTAPCCPGCGYNLTGNTSGVCPECGRTV
jgi:MFS family permease